MHSPEWHCSNAPGVGPPARDEDQPLASGQSPLDWQQKAAAVVVVVVDWEIIAYSDAGVGLTSVAESLRRRDDPIEIQKVRLGPRSQAPSCLAILEGSPKSCWVFYHFSP